MIFDPAETGERSDRQRMRNSDSRSRWLCFGKAGIVQPRQSSGQEEETHAGKEQSTVQSTDLPACTLKQNVGHICQRKSSLGVRKKLRALPEAFCLSFQLFCMLASVPVRVRVTSTSSSSRSTVMVISSPTCLRERTRVRSV